jgi:hypothetical protein
VWTGIVQRRICRHALGGQCLLPVERVPVESSIVGSDLLLRQCLAVGGLEFDDVQAGAFHRRVGLVERNLKRLGVNLEQPLRPFERQRSP